MTKEEYINILSETDELLEDYKNNSTGILTRCKTCGYTRKLEPRAYVKGARCKRCFNMRKSKKNEFLKKVNPNIEVISEYQNAFTPVLIRCKKCGTEQTAYPKSIMYGTKGGCTLCAKKSRKKTHDEFLSEMNNPWVEIVGEYINDHTPIKCKCVFCKNDWEARPYHLLNGHGCPKCIPNSTSYVEQFIYRAFCEILGDEEVINRDKSVIGKELDIFIPKLNIAIEPGTWKFHRNKQNSDKEKVDLCKKKGIKLIVIYYECRGEYNNGEIEAIHYNDNIALDIDKMAELLGILLSVCDIKYKITKELLLKFDEFAYKQSRRMTHDEFINLDTINPLVEVIGEYKGQAKKIECRCKKCGNVWSIQAMYISQGRGCKKCSNRNIAQSRLLSDEEYKNRLASLRPNIELLGIYSGGNNKTEFRCIVCGYEWQTTPAHLLRTSRNGCPKCSGHVKYSHQQFKEKVENISPDIEVLGEYINSRSRVKCLCRKCGKIWEPFANDLLHGSGCFDCYHAKRRS